MDIKKNIFLIMSVFVSTALFGQVNYFKTPDGKIVDSLEYFNLKSQAIERYKVKLKELNLDKSNSQTITLIDNLRQEYKTQDSIIYTYKWNIKINTILKDEVKGFDADKYLEKEFPFPELKTIDNKKIVINDLKGKPTLINFWFTTCKPCIEEMPVLNKIKSKFKDSVNFIAVNYEQTKKVRAFLSKHTYNFIQIADAEKFTDSLEMTSFPVNIFLDRNGKVIRIENGIPYIQDKNKKLVMGDGKDFEETLRKLL